LNNWAFSPNSQRKYSWKLYFLGTACASHMHTKNIAFQHYFAQLGAWQHTRGVSLLLLVHFYLLFFFVVFLSVSSSKLALRLGIEFPELVMSSKASWIFISCLPNSSWGVLLCQITWFFNRLLIKRLKLDWFRKKLEWHDSIWKHYKMSLKQ